MTDNRFHMQIKSIDFTLIFNQHAQIYDYSYEINKSFIL